MRLTLKRGLLVPGRNKRQPPVGMPPGRSGSATQFFWVNRQQLPAEMLDAMPDGTGKDLAELAEFVKGRD
jgi:hypothetical protein